MNLKYLLNLICPEYEHFSSRMMKKIEIFYVLFLVLSL